MSAAVMQPDMLSLPEAKAWLSALAQDVDPSASMEFAQWAEHATRAVMGLPTGGTAYLDAYEVLRRAERGLAHTIRNGQAAGLIMRRGRFPDKTFKYSTRDFFAGASTMTNIYALYDGSTELQFDAAVIEARADGGLMRPNLMRKLRGVKNLTLTPLDRLIKLRKLAPTGTSASIARELGISEDHLRRLARENDIVIPADRVMDYSRRVGSTYVVQQTVDTLDGLALGLRLVDFERLDLCDAQAWVESLTASIRTFSTLTRKIKERM